LELRAVLTGSHPEIWRQLELCGSMRLNQVHDVLQVAFGWQDSHLHRFTADSPFAPLRLVNGEIPDNIQWMPAAWCEEPGDAGEEDCSLEQLLTAGSGTAFYDPR
jgi:hypothetical protein